jgi:hypothetical protein
VDKSLLSGAETTIYPTVNTHFKYRGR